MLYNPQWHNYTTLPPFLRQIQIITEFYKLVFPNQELQLARNNCIFFQDRVILNFCNNVVSKFDKSLLTKFPGNAHIYDSIDNININKNRTNHIPQEFLQS